ncbi:4-carboxymuconolactone decarboxylase domain protein [Nitrospina gracilis 3/211]|uniref:4-carboxymuconolactone decarboxylase domain protein n=1 Tax=Nitrospina gracilis (strain 3/211) TaxID=1266370 RepID=M1Z226_NITG3|nr:MULTISPECIES: carboxymuconolactone decarboxylase family protein [Nitrospina]MCF8724781.1 putative peroxidase-related enzyme [Nitrospina sp. Nb-3]CCQ92056.1 4-carboxymuconolactone decarboxylase domain protein [Nitrospina gracilis 3/211]
MEKVTTKAQELLDKAEKGFGFVPNVLKELAVSPETLDLYLSGTAIMNDTVLNEREKQLVILAVSTFNGCGYCKAAHGMVATKAGASHEDVEAVKNKTPLKNERDQHLVDATSRTLEKKGWLTAEDLSEFEGWGIDRRQVFEIVGIIALKTITNYANHIAHTELDDVFKQG